MDKDISLPHFFKDSYAKIRRAEKHLAELQSEVANWKKANTPNGEARIVEKGNGRFSIEWAIEVPGPPECSGVIIGDIIHNLRVSLDLLAAELVRMSGESDKGVYFPFCHEAAFLDEMINRRRFHLAGDDAVELLKKFAPYNGGNGSLRALHDLDVQDKHIAIIPHTATSYTPAVEMQMSDTGLRPVPVDVLPDEMHLNFPPDSALAGVDIFEGLHEMVETTKGVVEAFTLLVASRQ